MDNEETIRVILKEAEDRFPGERIRLYTTLLLSHNIDPGTTAVICKQIFKAVRDLEDLIDTTEECIHDSTPLPFDLSTSNDLNQAESSQLGYQHKSVGGSDDWSFPDSVIDLNTEPTTKSNVDSIIKSTTTEKSVTLTEPTGMDMMPIK